MCATTTALADTLPSSIPKLDPSGTNWTVFLFRFQDAIVAKGFWGHFDGSSPRPTMSIPPKEEELAAKTQWEKDERSSKSLLTQKLPDSTMVLIHSKSTVKERWEEVVKEHTLKSEYAKIGLRAKFLGMKCSDRGGVREFLEGLRLKKEELCQARVDINEKDYFSVIISSLPAAMSNFASSQLAAAMDCQEFQNPCRLRVRVCKGMGAGYVSQPSPNPYPGHGFMGCLQVCPWVFYLGST